MSPWLLLITWFLYISAMNKYDLKTQALKTNKHYLLPFATKYTFVDSIALMVVATLQPSANFVWKYVSVKQCSKRLFTYLRSFSGSRVLRNSSKSFVKYMQSPWITRPCNISIQCNISIFILFQKADAFKSLLLALGMQSRPTQDLNCRVKPHSVFCQKAAPAIELAF